MPFADGQDVIYIALFQCAQTTAYATPRIICREEVGQSLQGRVRFFLRVRLQHGNNRDCSGSAFSARWWRLGIFAVARLTQLPNKHLHALFESICGTPRGTSTPN